jgi:ribonucleoside-triphosphate reductase
MSPTYSVCAEHGYLIGEQYKCPLCGKKTEVYSRITGYYRPVQNWNDGKSQEFKDRKVYEIKNSVLGNKGIASREVAPVVEEAAPAVCCSGEVLLFSRVTCPNCRVAEQLLNKAGVTYKKLIAEENVELCKQFGIKGAPTLVITDGENHQNFYSVPEIKKYLASL